MIEFFLFVLIEQHILFNEHFDNYYRFNYYYKSNNN